MRYGRAPTCRADPQGGPAMTIRLRPVAESDGVLRGHVAPTYFMDEEGSL